MIALFLFVAFGTFFVGAFDPRTDAVISAWRDEVPKKLNLVTVLAGDCRLHRHLAFDSPVYMVQGEDVGPAGLFLKLTQTLQNTCNDLGCPSQTIFISNADVTPVREMKEITYAFFNKKNCTTPEFGGFNQDCSRVWFVLSTCFGRNLTDTLGNELESQAPTLQEIESRAKFEMRLQWPNVGISFASLRIEREEENSENSATKLDDLITEYIARARTEAVDKNEPDSTSSITSGINLSVLSPEKSGYTGQEWARTAVERALKAVQNKLKMTRGPLVFFFLGPAGTGKTMLAKLVAQAYHGGTDVSTLEARNDFRLFAMGSYKSEEDVDAFVSPRAGLVGEGSMIDVFKKSTRPVIVLDEIEKAHPKLTSEMLLAWIDDNDGFVQDKKDSGKRFSTKDAIFILTSNCFAEEISQLNRQFPGNPEAVSEQVAKLLSSPAAESGNNKACNAFRREEVRRRMTAGHAMADLGRFGFVVFLPPTQDQVDKMVTFFLKDYKKKFPGGGFFWTSRAAEHLRKLARGSSHAGSGGLSNIQSAMSGAVTRALRETDQELGEDKDVLLFERNRKLMAGMIRRTSDGKAIVENRTKTTDAKPSHTQAIAQEQHNIHAASDAGTTGTNAQQQAVEVEHEKQQAVEVEHEKQQAVEVGHEKQIDISLDVDYLFYLQCALAMLALFAIAYYFGLWLGLSLVKSLALSLSVSFAPLILSGAYMCMLYPEQCKTLWTLLRHFVLPILAAIYHFFGAQGLVAFFVVIFFMPMSRIWSLVRTIWKSLKQGASVSDAPTTGQEVMIKPELMTVSPAVKKTATMKKKVRTPYGLGILVDIRSLDRIHVVQFDGFHATGYLCEKDVILM